MYDIHAHILPGVDDGPDSMEASVEMARAAVENGTHVMLATPHRKDVTERWSVGHIVGLVDELNARARAERLDFRLLLGMENHLDTALPAEISAGRALPMNGSRYILVEMPFFGRPEFIDSCLAQVMDLGLVPVLAHPERIEAFQRDIGLLKEFVGLGMVSQITAGSLLGRWGDEVKGFTSELLKMGLAHVIASDTHTPGEPRPPGLAAGAEAAARVVGTAKAQAMVASTPRRILEDLPVKWPQE
ncbi:MAG: tyrosine protein phosphatase [Chloroflexi bacterium]|nr:tyrosine protein phosphatase [Chloroflexota bacterium]